MLTTLLTDMEPAMTLDELLLDVRACTHCQEHLPLGPKPILKLHEHVPLLLASQAPGTKAHQSGIPWDDLSGIRLREWLGMEDDFFFDRRNVGILPMGFCYPGKGGRGDLPPRPECASLWHQRILAKLTHVRLILTIGQYAQKYYLGKKRKRNLTETVRNWKEYYEENNIIPLPHPSPINIMWRRKNPWFESEVIPEVRQKVWEVFIEET